MRRPDASFFLPFVLIAACFAQQADAPKPATPKKQASAQSAEKPADAAIKPEPASEPKPMPREAASDRD